MQVDKVLVALVGDIGDGGKSREGKKKREVVWRSLRPGGKGKGLLDTLDTSVFEDRVQDMVQDPLDEMGKETQNNWPRACMLPRLRSEPSVVHRKATERWKHPTNGLAMLNGILFVEAAQHRVEQQIYAGVKCNIGRRQRMEDSHLIALNFMRLPLSLECTEDVLPDYLSRLPRLGKRVIPGSPDWRNDRRRLCDLYGQSIQCVFDDFHMFTLCDGHGGSAVASYCTDNVRRNLEKALNENLKESFGNLLSLCSGAPKRKRDDDEQEADEWQIPVLSPSATAEGTECPGPNFESQHMLRKDETDNVNQASSHSLAQVADASPQEFHSAIGALESELEKLKVGLTPEEIARSMRLAFEWLNNEVLKENLGQVQGSTMVMSLVGSWFICIASCGDSRGVLARGEKCIRLTRDHKPNLEDEKKRIDAEGGFVVEVNGCSRVNGILAMTRAIGDHTFKGITSAPEVAVFQREEADEFLILASDGLWDVIGDEEACTMVRRTLHRADTRGAPPLVASRVAANVLVRAALSRGTPDNTTVIVVDLRHTRPCNYEGYKKQKIVVGS